jgi:menaquinone-dependent protoporphyrinogen IX oxidase
LKTLIAYYSKTGMNERVAYDLQKKLRCDIEEIVDREDRHGLLGFLKSGFQASLRRRTKIARARRNPAKYDLLILVSPIWASLITPALRTYVQDNIDAIRKAGKVAFVSVSGGGSSGNFHSVEDLEAQIGQKTAAFLMLAEHEVKHQIYEIRLDQFIKKVQGKNR